MILFWILTVVFFVLTMISCYWLFKSDNKGVLVLPFVVLLCVFASIAGLYTPQAIKNRAIYTDMAENPQCYTLSELQQARQEIVAHKMWVNTPFTFYPGYEFPDIKIDIPESTDTTLQIVK